MPTHLQTNRLWLRPRPNQMPLCGIQHDGTPRYAAPPGPYGLRVAMN